MVHSKKSVYAFNSKLMDHLKTVLPWPVTHVHYWSDRAAGQFKNRYTFASLVFHKDFDCTADWSYFCTVHGKRPIDGVGGHVKRSVCGAVLQKKVTVTSPVDFYNAATSLSQEITVLWLSSEDIEAATQHLDARFEDTPAVAGVHQFHHVVPIDDENVHVSRNSPFTGPQKVYERRVVVSPSVSNDEPAMHTGTKRSTVKSVTLSSLSLTQEDQ